ncbi:DUF2161 domain-containing phosphodiesterase [Paenibacillus sp. P25]|nr:DUF2161 domain-containing phosphodiesterase [Paenibacillus sp. P25]
MLTVQFYKTRRPRVQLECHPPSDEHPLYSAPRHNKRAATRLVTEFQERRADYNTGGNSKRKLVTSYREKSLHLAWRLQVHGPLSPKRLRELTGNSRAAGMLQRNVYFWFKRVERGVYELTPAGEEALRQFAHVVTALAESPLSKPV